MLKAEAVQVNRSKEGDRVRVLVFEHVGDEHPQVTFEVVGPAGRYFHLLGRHVAELHDITADAVAARRELEPS